MVIAVLACAGVLVGIAAQLSDAQRTPPNTFPQNYTGLPNTSYSSEWQTYFEVTSPLPNVTTGSLSRSFAGNIATDRAGHPNDTLFFWGFEKENGSLSAGAGERENEPWLIWLNGGPGSSSFLGFMTENGPLHVTNDYSIVHNNFSWDRLADAFWVDQPVGTGYSTADSSGYVANENQTGQDFLGFLANLVKVFPSLATRPFYLTGESYSGMYIPYITKAYFSTPNPPVNLKKISIGDGAIGSLAEFMMISTVTTIETYPQLIGYDPEVYEYFKSQEHLCGYDLNITYPQNGTFPTLLDPSAGLSSGRASSGLAGKMSWKSVLADRYASKATLKVLKSRDIEEREGKKMEWKRDLTGRANGTIDPWYGCDSFDMMIDYAVNFTFPWTNGGFDVYDIPDALNPEAPSDPGVFLNNNDTRSALHAPTSKNWVSSFDYPFNSSYSQAIGANAYGDPSVEAMLFMTDLATNASAHNVSLIFYSGNDDALVGHKGTQVVIQNMTFGGIQGFTRAPSTPWYDDDGNFAGIVHQERNVTYALFDGAGHLVPEWKPEAAYVFLREFILGDNTTGLVSGNRTVGGENATLGEDTLPGTTVIFYGSGTTSASVVEPSASIAAWNSFLATATASILATASISPTTA
ncbi:hypothetical protein PLICRDRAFT_34311 [Plicaturopsis crispa FD-325 SS-3]|nr:hypothetical protein PLICRDRAFT_34311 [Plicaturopsis crispa FD-325 SS-3]